MTDKHEKCEGGCDSNRNCNVCVSAQDYYDLVNFVDYVAQDNIWWSLNSLLYNAIQIQPITGVTKIKGSDMATLANSGLYIPALGPFELGSYGGTNILNFFKIDPSVDICALQKQYGPLYRALRTPKKNFVPKAEQLDLLGNDQFNAILQYVIKKINELCIPECTKLVIVDKILNIAFINLDFNFDNHDSDRKPIKNLCGDNGLPECGPLYIANGMCDGQNLIIDLLLKVKFVLFSYFNVNCVCKKHDDCDLTLEQACKIVFGRFCIIKVDSKLCN